jgi:hypothetical protein
VGIAQPCGCFRKAVWMPKRTARPRSGYGASFHHLISQRSIKNPVDKEALEHTFHLPSGRQPKDHLAEVAASKELAAQTMFYYNPASRAGLDPLQVLMGKQPMKDG